jgi:hypothetical protein
VECLRAAYSDLRLCRLGVLSHRLVRTFRRYYQNLGPVLYAYQPNRVSENFYVLEDADFLVPENISQGLCGPNPVVTCDLLLTSNTVLETTESILDMFKFAMISKWLKLAGPKGAEDMVDSFYSSRTFTSEHRQWLKKEIERLSSRKADLDTLRVSQNSSTLESLARTSIRDDLGIKNFDDRYQLTCFIGIPNISSPRCCSSNPSQTNQQLIAAPKFIFDPQVMEYVRSTFSSNSTGFCTRAKLNNNGTSVDVFVKTGSGSNDLTPTSSTEMSSPPSFTTNTLPIS